MILYFTFLFSLFVFVSAAGQYFSILTEPDQYIVFFRILSELVFCLRYTIKKNMSSDRFACIEYKKKIVHGTSGQMALSRGGFGISVGVSRRGIWGPLKVPIGSREEP